MRAQEPAPVSAPLAQEPEAADASSRPEAVPSRDEPSATSVAESNPVPTEDAEAVGRSALDSHVTQDGEASMDPGADVPTAGTDSDGPDRWMEDYPLLIHAFASQGYLLSVGNNYIPHSKRGSFELAEVGINFTRQLTEDLRAGLQLFARDFGAIGNYSAKLDWFYLDYRPVDWLGFRAGRIKIPFGLYNESQDIDAARVPVLLPQSLYPNQNRDFLLAHTGMELYGRFGVGAGTLEYRAYVGTIFMETTNSPSAPYDVASLDIPHVVGGRLMWEPPIEGLRLGGTLQALRLDASLAFDPAAWQPMQMMGALPPEFRGQVDVKIPAVLWVASAEYSTGDALVAAEYSRWHVRTDSSHPTLFPESDTTISERMHVMAAYRLTPWLQPGAYYALNFSNVDDRRGRDAQQHDVALTFRFDVNDHWLVKVEGHYMNGTALVNPALNDNVPRTDLPRSWAMLLLKTTAYF